MTSSDKKMDRALSSMPVLAPGYSAWPAVQARLDEQVRSRRKRRVMGYGFSGIAASLMIALGVASQFAAEPKPSVNLQSTVDAAIRDARPQAMFTGFSLTEPRPELRALLVSAKPRGEIQAVHLGELLDKKRRDGSSAHAEQQLAPTKENPINEF